jgi:hypothetical protein
MVYLVDLTGCYPVHLTGGVTLVAKVHEDEKAKRVKGSFATEKTPSQGRFVASPLVVEHQQMTSTPFRYTLNFISVPYLLTFQDSRTRAPG